MQFDYIIQKGVWTGSSKQRECVRQAARDANFEGYNSIDEYINQIETGHNEDGTDGARGPIDAEAYTYFASQFDAAWAKRAV